MDRDYILTNERSLSHLKDLITRLSEEDVTRGMSDGWSVAAYFGQLAFWDRRVSRLIDRWLDEGYTVPTHDPHTTNDAMKPSLLLVPPTAAEEADHTVAALSDLLLEQIIAGCWAATIIVICMWTNLKHCLHD